MIASIKPMNNNTNFHNLYRQGKEVWGVLGNVIHLTKCTLSGLAASERFVAWSGKNTPLKLEGIVTHLNLFSAFSIVFAIDGAKSSAEKTWRHLQQGKCQQAALSVLLFGINACDVAGSSITVLNAALKIHSKKPIEWLSKLGTQLAYAICTMSILRSGMLIFTIKQLDKSRKEGIKIVTAALIIIGLRALSVIPHPKPWPFAILGSSFAISLGSSL